MSFDLSGADEVVTAGAVSIDIGNQHPLIMLANALPWMLLSALVLPDLKGTTARGFWWTGRKLRVRVHLAIFILQKLYDLTDRQTEYAYISPRNSGLSRAKHAFRSPTISPENRSKLS